MEPNSYTVRYGEIEETTVATQVRFSPACLFTFDGNAFEQKAFKILNNHLEHEKGGLAVCGRLFNAFSEMIPVLRGADCLISNEDNPIHYPDFKGEIVSFSNIPPRIKRVFLCEVKSLELDRLRKKSLKAWKY